VQAGFERRSGEWLLGPQTIRTVADLGAHVRLTVYSPLLLIEEDGRKRDGAVNEWTHRLQAGDGVRKTSVRGFVPNGIRTRVLALKGPRPGPLDDGDSRV
jgi:hypothetical protein